MERKIITVGIMAGHGGSDRGTTVNGFDEADFCLEFARDFQLFACRALDSVRFVLLRSGDECCSLTEGARRAEDLGCNVVLLFHVNSGSDSLRGGLLFHLDCNGLSARIASTIHKAYPQSLAPMTKKPISVPLLAGDDDWRSRARNVLVPYTDRLIAPVLVELFYASDTTDVAFGNASWVKAQIFDACMAGVVSAIR